MRHEYTLRTPDGDRPYLHVEGRPPLVKDEVITLPNGEPFAVTRIVKQPDGQGRGGVVDVHANRTR